MKKVYFIFIIYLTLQIGINIYYLIQEKEMTDITKYKSLIVRVETHKKLKKLAGRDRKISGILSQLVDKEYEKRIGA